SPSTMSRRRKSAPRSSTGCRGSTAPVPIRRLNSARRSRRISKPTTTPSDMTMTRAMIAVDMTRLSRGQWNAACAGSPEASLVIDHIVTSLRIALESLIDDLVDFSMSLPEGEDKAEISRRINRLDHELLHLENEN